MCPPGGDVAPKFDLPTIEQNLTCHGTTLEQNFSELHQQENFVFFCIDLFKINVMEQNFRNHKPLFFLVLKYPLPVTVKTVFLQDH